MGKMEMKKMEAEHGVLVNCNNEGKDKKKNSVFLFLTGKQERDVLNTMT